MFFNASRSLLRLIQKKKAEKPNFSNFYHPPMVPDNAMECHAPAPKNFKIEGLHLYLSHGR